MLQTLKSKLESLVVVCQEKYKSNELKISTRNETVSKANTKRGRYRGAYVCGSPYFKDSLLSPAPSDPDYLYRKLVQNEFFPMDLVLKRKNKWTSFDKTDLIYAYKHQITEFLTTEYKLEIKRFKSNKVKCAEMNDKLMYLYGKNFYQLYPLISGTSFKPDWDKISVVNLAQRHEPEQCIAMWNACLIPHLKRDQWTTEENELLVKAVEEFDCQNWKKISEKVPNRSKYQCFIHFQSNLASKLQLKVAKWSREEDEFLINSIEKYRIGTLIPWTRVIESIPSRSKTQCYNRYMFTLRPGIKKEKFSTEEDCILMAAVQEYGSNFSNMPSNLLPGRTLVHIRNRYNNVLKLVGKTSAWTTEEDEAMMKMVEEFGTSSWAKIADVLKTHTRFSCRTRHRTISQFLEKNPKLSIKDAPRKKKSTSSNITEDNWMETIIKIKREKESPKKLSMSKTFREKLSKENRFCYDYFKYSFNFDYGEILVPSNSASNSIVISAHILDFMFNHRDFNLKKRRFSPQQICALRSFNVKLEYDWVQELLDLRQKQFYFPPSWSTVLGMRGISLIYSEDEENNEQSDAVDAENSEKLSKIAAANIDFKEALASFRKRFFSIFYWPMVLSQININECTDTVIEEIPAEPPVAFFKIEQNASSRNFELSMIQNNLKIDGKRKCSKPGVLKPYTKKVKLEEQIMKINEF